MYWRPLRLFVALPMFLAVAKPAATQIAFPSQTTIQLRLGGFGATPLVEDEVSSVALDDSIAGTRSNFITLRQKPGPIATVAVRFPLKPRTQLEVSGSVARSMVQGNDGLETWDAMSVTVGNVLLGFGYLYRGALALRAGIGLTKLFAEERGVFTKGNSAKPLFEGGASVGLSIANRPIEIDARLQSHGFGTATLRDNGGSDGNVTRAIVQIGTTLWKAGR